MALLQNIRVKFGVVISVIIALALLSFIIDPGTLESALYSMSSKNDVGVIDGKSISYQDFQGEVDRYSTIQEMMTGSTLKSDEAQKQTRDAAWQGLVDRMLFIKNAKAAGINVGEDEMAELITGDMVSPLISRNYMFCDETGSFNPDAVKEFVSNISADESGRAAIYWNYIQNAINVQQYYNKYGALFTVSGIDNPLMLRRAVAENNVTSDIELVTVPFPYMADSTIVVTDKEIKDYYKAHKEDFRQKESRDIEYVVFEVVPSKEDVAAANDKMVEVYEEFCSTSSIKSFLARNSERPYSEYWYKKGELSEISSALDDYAFGPASNAPSGIINVDDSFFAIRVIATAKLPDEVFVKHILLQGDNAAEEAEQVLGELRGGKNFSDLVALHSVDQNSSAEGELGAIGWMSQKRMIPGFESVMDAQAGKPFILNTQYGTHVVLVTKKSELVEKKQVAILEKTAIAGNETFNSYYSKANRFATMAAGGYDNYRKAVDSLGVYSQNLNVLESTSSIGSVANAKEVTRWAFDNKPGKVSEIMTINGNYFFIATVKGEHKEGVATINEVASSIRDILANRKIGEKKTLEVKEKIEGLNEMTAIAEALNTAVSTRNGIAFSSLTAAGADPALVGAVAAASEGEICGPVKGAYAVYVFKVTKRETGSFFTEEDARNVTDQKNQYVAQTIVPVMMEDAGVKDHRDRFY